MDSDSKPTPQPAPDARALDPVQQRRQLIDSYRNAGLQMDNPLAANLAVLNADLMDVAAETVVSVTELLQRARQDCVALADCERWANLHLRFVKQVDRLSQIALKLEEPEA